MRLKLLIGLMFGILPLSIALPLNSFAQSKQSIVVQAQQTPSGAQKVVIARIWHGRTKTAKADEYYKYLKDAGITKIQSIPGNRGVQVLRRSQGDVTEFTVISYWDSLDAIRKFAGNDIEKLITYRVIRSTCWS